MNDLEALEALAKAATACEWVSYTPTGAALNPFEATFVAGPIPRYMDRLQGFCPVDGNYIAAANPSTVLSLIAEVRALREDAGRYRFARENVQEGYALPGGFYLSEEGGESWDKTIDAARKETT